jgi:hypothetical protein
LLQEEEEEEEEEEDKLGLLLRGIGLRAPEKKFQQKYSDLR